MSILGIIGALFVLGVLVFVHELGHFLAAKITGVKVLTFSIFMGKKLFTKKIGETEYAISAVPFGGYVKMLGQEDMPDPEANARLKGNPDEFPSKTVGQRIFIAFMGPLMNFLFAVFVLWIAFMLGVPEPVNPKGLYIGSVPENSPAGEAGIKVHDRIISVNGKEMNSWEDVYIEVVSGDGDSLPVKVLRRGDTLSFRVKPEYNDDLNQYFIEIGRYYPPVVRGLVDDYPAGKAGISKGDTMVAFNGEPVGQISDLVKTLGNNKEETADITVLRGSDTLNFSVTPKYDSEADRFLLGVNFVGITKKGPAGAVISALRKTGEDMTMMFRHLGKLFTGRVSLKLVSGPVGIVNVTSKMIFADIVPLLMFVALISSNLVIVNLFPFLIITDGGMILFLLIEKLRGGRPLPPSVQLNIQRFGVALILTIAAAVTFNDLFRIFR